MDATQPGLSPSSPGAIKFMNALNDAFPDFEAYVIDEFGTADGHTPHVSCGFFVQFLADKYEAGQTQELQRAGELIERLLSDEDTEVQNLASVGIIEGILFVWSHKPYGGKAFSPYLLAKSRQRYEELEEGYGKLTAGNG